MDNIDLKRKVEVFGALILGYAQACINLNVVAGSKASNLTTGIEVVGWYELEQFRKIEEIVIQTYKKADAILIRIGMEMMFGWYYQGPGKDIIKKGVDFLHYQTGSQGFSSVVKGPKELVGDFSLEEINLIEGNAVVHSTTVFNRKIECGVIIGGMLAPGDLVYVDVDNRKNQDYLKIEFH